MRRTRCVPWGRVFDGTSPPSPPPRAYPLSVQDGSTALSIAKRHKNTHVVHLLEYAPLLRDVVPCKRLKLCLCGFGGAGKTQLLRSLQKKQSIFFTAKDDPRSLSDRTPGVSAEPVDIGGLKFSALDFGAYCALPGHVFDDAAIFTPSPHCRRSTGVLLNVSTPPLPSSLAAVYPPCFLPATTCLLPNPMPCSSLWSVSTSTLLTLSFTQCIG